MVRQETKRKAIGEPESVNYIVTDIPTSPGQRAVLLCLHAVFERTSVFMDTRGAARCQLDAGQGAAASAVALAGASPAEPGFSSCCPGARVACGGCARPWGLRSGKGLRGQAGCQSLLELSLCVKS